MFKGKLAMALAAAMVLAATYGCSSNSGIKSDRDMYKEEAAALQGQVDDLTGQLATVTAERDQALADLGVAQGHVTTLMGQVSDKDGEIATLMGQVGDKDGEIATLTMARDGLQSQLDALNMSGRPEDQTMISDLNMQIAGLDTQISDLTMARDGLQQMLNDANAKVAMLEQDVADAEAETKAAADTAAAKKLHTALLKATVDAVTDPTVTVEASSAGAFSAKSTGFTMAGYADAISGFRGAMLEMDTQSIAVYSEIANAKATPIGDIYRSSADPGKTAVYSVIQTPTDTGHEIAWGDVKRSDENHSTTGAGDTAVTTFAGSVRGVAGVFSCGGASCTVPEDPDSSTSATGWTFQPTNANANIDVADNAYVMFGWWLDKGDGGATDPFMTAAFASAVGMEANTTGRQALADDVESATYNGGAAGKYAILSTTEDSAQGGHFTASASVSVNWEAGTGNDQVGIKGTISNFTTGDTARPSWKVTLSEVLQSDNSAFTNGVSSWSTGGAVAGPGTWGAMLWGEGDDDEPTAVTGTFDAEMPAIARIAGAFGATK